VKDIILNLIAALIFVVIGAIASRAFAFYQLRFRKEYTKVTYYRVIRLRSRGRGDDPYYVRHHHTVERISEPVFDEAWCLNSTQCNQNEILQPIQFSSSGLVDAIQIMPVLSENADNHPHTRAKTNTFVCAHSEPTTHLTAVGTMVNGLQTEDQWWYGTTAQYDGQTLLLILDFTSLTYETRPISDVRSRLERNSVSIPKHNIESQWVENHYGSDLFYLKYKNAKKGDVIKFEFVVNWELVPVVKDRSSIPRPSKA
jgi:hypothetical protein